MINRTVSGYLLLTVSTVAASVFASPTPVLTLPFTVSLAAMAFSLWLVRRKQAPGEPARESEADAFDHLACLESVAGALARLAEQESLTCGQIHRELDPLIEGAVFDFAVNREALLARLDYGAYSRVVGDFTQAERILNRAWSAAVDSYPGEAVDMLRLARELFEEVAALLKRYLQAPAEVQE
ncbi:MAG: hypothetical protein JXQ83_06585 [Candidatus Glassbacteria bacterium]|nr:hypothetical protein [Candidatus Glassbacteria bacterium]